MSLQKQKGVKKTGKGAQGELYAKLIYIDGKRHKINLGRMSKRDAQEVSGHIDHLNRRREVGTRLREETEAWLSGIGEKLREKLLQKGLVEPIDVVQDLTWSMQRDAFLQRKGMTAKPRTMNNFRLAVEAFDSFLDGRDPILKDVKVAEAKLFETWMLNQKSRTHKSEPKKLSPNTVSRRIARIKEIFEDALEDEHIGRNPFRAKGINYAVEAAPKEYIPSETIERVIDSLRDDQLEWKLIFAFARFVGCRMPSEIQTLTWERVKFEEGFILLEDQKRGGNRQVPIFDEVAALLQEQHERCQDVAYVFPVLRHGRNQSTTAKKYVRKAGFKVWGEFFNALRASRETDLMDSHNLRLACQWIGNSAKVAEHNYRLVKGTDFDEFKRIGSKSVPNGSETGRIEQK